MHDASVPQDLTFKGAGCGASEPDRLGFLTFIQHGE